MDPVVAVGLLLFVFVGLAVTFPWVAAGVAALVVLVMVGALFDRTHPGDR